MMTFKEFYLQSSKGNKISSSTTEEIQTTTCRIKFWIGSRSGRQPSVGLTLHERPAMQAEVGSRVIP